MHVIDDILATLGLRIVPVSLHPENPAFAVSNSDLAEKLFREKPKFPRSTVLHKWVRNIQIRTDETRRTEWIADCSRYTGTQDRLRELQRRVSQKPSFSDSPSQQILNTGRSLKRGYIHTISVCIVEIAGIPTDEVRIEKP